jgi:serine/threonine protein kinase
LGVALQVGEVFAGYTVERLLGSGGMGEVYLVAHPRLPRRDALKILPAEFTDDPDYQQRFLREADLASTLYHPGIVGVHDRGEHQGQLWISMDFVDGTDVAARLSAHPDGLPVAEVRDIVTAVAEALDFAHDRGLLHRDVKPANILLTAASRGRQRALLADFGIARHSNDAQGLTATNMTLGTVNYAAPEQLLDEPLSGATDQYALAATAYHLLAGTAPFMHSNPVVVIGKHLNAAPPPLSSHRPELAGLNPVLTRALAKDPAARYPSCQDFADALAAVPISADAAAPVVSPAISLPASDSKTMNLKAPPLIVSSRTTDDKFDAAVPDRPKSRTPAAAAPPASKQERSVSTTSGRSAPSTGGSANSSQRLQSLAMAALGVTLIVVVAGLAAAAVLESRANRSDTVASQTATATTSVAPTYEAPVSAAPAPTSTTPPPPATASPKAVDTVLLTSDELSNQLGIPVSTNVSTGSALKLDASNYGPSDHSSQVTPSSCAGVVFTAEHNVYDKTDVQQIKTQTYSPGPGMSYSTGPEYLEQTAAVFPSAESAEQFVSNQQTQWQNCANANVDAVLGYENGRRFTLGSVRRQDALVSVSMASWGGENGSHACQQVLGAHVNVVVAVRTCQLSASAENYRVGDPVDPGWAVPSAVPLGRAMLDKVEV